MRLSKSGILTYKNCPRKFKYQYINKLSAGTSPEMERGKMLHDKFEKFYDGIEKAEDIFHEKWDEWKKDHDTHNFLKFNSYMYDKLKDKKDIIPIAREKKYFDQENNLVGIIDAVYKVDDKYVILDYKTGKFNENYVSEYRFELAIYVHLWNIFNKEKITHWGIFFTKVGKLWTEKIKKQSIDLALQKVTDVRKDVIAKKFEPKYSILCAWCNFVDNCVQESMKNGEENHALNYTRNG